MVEEILAKRKAEADKENADTSAAAEAQEANVEKKVVKRMGVIRYYVTPWSRHKVREQVKRIEQIQKQLDAEGGEDSDQEGKDD